MVNFYEMSRMTCIHVHDVKTQQKGPHFGFLYLAIRPSVLINVEIMLANVSKQRSVCTVLLLRKNNKQSWGKKTKGKKTEEKRKKNLQHHPH